LNIQARLQNRPFNYCIVGKPFIRYSKLTSKKALFIFGNDDGMNTT